FVRTDFPGGWSSDSMNKFTMNGRNTREEDIWKYIAKLADFRKKSSALTTGKMMQYSPKEGEYVFFRYNKNQTVMTVLNTAKEKKIISIKNYPERTNGFSTMKNIITGEVTNLEDFSIDAKGSGVWELQK
ncbi:MAG TPA: cyclomaltodextrinase C-terminal domain-containing protein, partial [Chitinophagaceae bacterium]